MEAVIRLEAIESLLLADRIQATDVYFENGDRIAKELLLKLFSVVNQITTDTALLQEEVEMGVTEKELWLMASKISPFDKVDGKLVGLKLRRKIHALILGEESKVDLPFRDVEEVEYPTRKEKKDADTYEGYPENYSND